MGIFPCPTDRWPHRKGPLKCAIQCRSVCFPVQLMILQFLISWTPWSSSFGFLKDPSKTLMILLSKYTPALYKSNSQKIRLYISRFCPSQGNLLSETPGGCPHPNVLRHKKSENRISNPAERRRQFPGREGGRVSLGLQLCYRPEGQLLQTWGDQKSQGESSPRRWNLKNTRCF